MPTPTATIFVPYSALDDVLLRGPRAAQPAASAVVPGTLYCVTDEGAIVEQSNGSAWSAYSPAAGGGSGGGGTPAPHHVSHQPGGTDAIVALDAGILTTGTLPDARLSATVQLKPIAPTDLPAHAAQHANGGADPVTVTTLAGYPGGTTTFLRADGTFATPSAGTPSAHHTTHEAGGSDVVTLAQSQVPGLPTALAGKVDTTDPRLTDARAPTAHHATHETGGSDAIAALSGAVITTGTVADARLSANVPLLNAANTFTATQTVSTSLPMLVFDDASQPADQRVFRLVNNAQQFYVQAVNDALTSAASQLLITRSGDLIVWRDVYEKSRPTPLGHWLDVPYNAANFAALGATWTVSAGNVITNRYTLIGKTLIWTVNLDGTTLAANPSDNALRINLPPGVASATGAVRGVIASDGSGRMDLYAYPNPNPGGTQLFLYKYNFTAWSAGTVIFNFTILLEIP